MYIYKKNAMYFYKKNAMYFYKKNAMYIFLLHIVSSFLCSLPPLILINREHKLGISENIVLILILCPIFFSIAYGGYCLLKSRYGYKLWKELNHPRFIKRIKEKYSHSTMPSFSENGTTLSELRGHLARYLKLEEAKINVNDSIFKIIDMQRFDQKSAFDFFVPDVYGFVIEDVMELLNAHYLNEIKEGKELFLFKGKEVFLFKRKDTVLSFFQLLSLPLSDLACFLDTGLFIPQPIQRNIPKTDALKAFLTELEEEVDFCFLDKDANKSLLCIFCEEVIKQNTNHQAKKNKKVDVFGDMHGNFNKFFKDNFKKEASWDLLASLPWFWGYELAPVLFLLSLSLNDFNYVVSMVLVAEQDQSDKNI